MDAGDGWFDLPLPPAELAVHPAEEGGWAELYPLCHDVAVTVTALRAEGSTWPGRSATRAGGCCGHRVPRRVELGLYQPRHLTGAQPS